MVSRRFRFRKPARQKGKRRQRSAALKLLFLALRQAAKKWTMPSHHGCEALHYLTILRLERMPATETLPNETAAGFSGAGPGKGNCPPSPGTPSPRPDRLHKRIDTPGTAKPNRPRLWVLYSHHFANAAKGLAPVNTYRLRFDSAAVFRPLRSFQRSFLNKLSSLFQVCQLSFQVGDGFFSMAYLLLNFARLLLGFPFGFQNGIIRNLSDLLLDGSLDFVEAALEVVFRAGFHISPSPS